MLADALCVIAQKGNCNILFFIQSAVVIQVVFCRTAHIFRDIGKQIRIAAVKPLFGDDLIHKRLGRNGDRQISAADVGRIFLFCRRIFPQTDGGHARRDVVEGIIIHLINFVCAPFIKHVARLYPIAESACIEIVRQKIIGPRHFNAHMRTGYARFPQRNAGEIIVRIGIVQQFSVNGRFLPAVERIIAETLQPQVDTAVRIRTDAQCQSILSASAVQQHAAADRAVQSEVAPVRTARICAAGIAPRVFSRNDQSPLLRFHFVIDRDVLPACVDDLYFRYGIRSLPDFGDGTGNAHADFMPRNGLRERDDLPLSVS